MKTLFATLALVAMTASPTLTGEQPKNLQLAQQDYQQPGPNNQPQNDNQAGPNDQPQGGNQPPPVDQSQGTDQAGDQQRGDDQAGDESGGDYSTDSVGRDTAAHGHKKKLSVPPPSAPWPDGVDAWGLPPFMGRTKEEWDQYQVQNAAALARQKKYYEENVPQCTDSPQEPGKPVIEFHGTCRIGQEQEAARNRETEKSQALNYATNEYGHCTQDCSNGGAVCTSPYEEEWTHGHNDCRGQYDRCIESCRQMYNARVTTYGLPTK